MFPDKFLASWVKFWTMFLLGGTHLMLFTHYSPWVWAPAGIFCAGLGLKFALDAASVEA